MPRASKICSALVDHFIIGNGHFQIVRDRRRRPLELVPMMSSMVRPRWVGDIGVPALPADADPSKVIVRYDYWVDGVPVPFAPEEVLHLPFMSPDWRGSAAGRIGISPMRSVLREIYREKESGNFESSIVTNMGVSAAVLSSEAEGKGFTPQQAKEFVAELQARISGGNRGKISYVGHPIKAHRMGASPDEFSVKEFRRIAEERICAVLNVPATVAGLGAGLDHATMRNTEEYHKEFWWQSVIPLQDQWAEVLTRALLTPEDVDKGRRIGFDRSRVMALQKDRKAEADADLVEAQRAREEIGNGTSSPVRELMYRNPTWTPQRARAEAEKIAGENAAVGRSPEPEEGALEIRSVGSRQVLVPVGARRAVKTARPEGDPAAAAENDAGVEYWHDAHGNGRYRDLIRPPASEE